MSINLGKKRCCDCRVRPRVMFSRSARNTDGLQTICKDCAKTRRIAWREARPGWWRPKDAEHERARQRDWAARNRDKKAATFKRWYDKHGSDYRDANKDRQNPVKRAWAQANPEANNEYSARRRAKKLALRAEDVDRDAVWYRDGGTCYLCKLPAMRHDWHLDHVNPLTRGGEHSYANTAVTHPSCNMSKGDLTPDEYWTRRTIRKLRVTLSERNGRKARAV